MRRSFVLQSNICPHLSLFNMREDKTEEEYFHEINQLRFDSLNIFHRTKCLDSC